MASSVAVLGDSYAAGEGTYNNGSAGNPPSIDYYLSTRTWNGQSGCHRSPGAYAPLLDVRSQSFVACSGATIGDITNGSKGFPSQLNVLHPGIDVVIVSVTGDDLGFSGVLNNCIDLATLFGIGFHHTTMQQCQDAINTGIAQIPEVMGQLSHLYGTIGALTNGAHIIQVGYPELFPDNGSTFCNFISTDRQKLINDAVDQLDEALLIVASLNPHVTFVDTRALFDGHEVCGADKGQYINDLQTDQGLANNCPSSYLSGPACSQSFHPNTLAYAAEANLLKPLVDELLKVAGQGTAPSSTPAPVPSSSPHASTPSPTASTPAPTASATPGHATAEDAAAGFYQSELAGDWSQTTGACSYVQPDAQALCASGTQGYGSATGHFTVVGAVIQAPRALVEVIGHITAPDGSQSSNSDPTSGMPLDPAGFDTIYNNLTNSPATIMSPVPCIEVNGQWYVNEGG